MILTWLYSSSLLKDNKNRNVYIYAIGTIIYVIIHWLLFSAIGEQYPMLRGKRNVIYAIFAGDLINLHYMYEKSRKDMEEENKKIKPEGVKIDEIKETDNDKEGEIENKKSSKKCVSGQCSVKEIEHESKRSVSSSNEKKETKKESNKEIKKETGNDSVSTGQQDIKSAASIPTYKGISETNLDIPVYVPKSDQMKSHSYQGNGGIVPQDKHNELPNQINGQTHVQQQIMNDNEKREDVGQNIVEHVDMNVKENIVHDDTK